MLKAMRRKLAISCLALAAALSMALALPGVAYAWNLDFVINGTCDTLTATGFYEERGEQPGGPVDAQGNPVDFVNFQISADGELVREGKFIFPNVFDENATNEERGSGTADIERLEAGEYQLEWQVFFFNGGDKPNDESGSAKLNIESCEEPPSEPPSAGPSETPKDEPPADEPPAEEPPADQGSTLPKTGSGFPTGTAAAFALFLVSVGGFLLTWRRGMLSIAYRRRH